MLKRATVLKAVTDGVVFEICYGIAMRSSSTGVPKDARRNVMAGARELIRITGGKNIVFSGDVAKCLEMRAPHDLINLCVRSLVALRSCLMMDRAQRWTAWFEA